MNEDELLEMCNIYKESILSEPDTEAYLMMLVRNVERETRQRCVSAAYDLANKLNNLGRD